MGAFLFLNNLVLYLRRKVFMKQIRSKKLPKFFLNFLPNYYIQSVDRINENTLRKNGIKAVAFDLDSTLTHHKQFQIDPKTIQFIKNLKIPIYIATNRFYKNNLELLKTQIGAKSVITATKSSRKPNKNYYRRLVRLTGCNYGEIAFIGDRLLTDIYGANRVGLTSIMVKNIGPDPLFIKIFQLRKIESILLRLFSKTV